LFDGYFVRQLTLFSLNSVYTIFSANGISVN
jgi:hypothetical protein